MTTLLLTNDDGIDSPALLPTYHALAPLFDEVRVVVPHIERSWIGKAITRHDEMTVDHVTRSGVEITTVSGYPADCTQIGIFNTGDGMPDMVVSGINIGGNHSTAYLYGSGTVGAAVEAALVGVPALAFSASSGADNYPTWNQYMRSADSGATWDEIARVSARIVAKVLAAGFPADVDVLTVNLPDGLSEASPHRVAPLGYTSYGQLFREQRPGVFKHQWKSDVAAKPGVDLADTDIELCHNGTVVITPLRLPQLGADVQSTAELFS